MSTPEVVLDPRNYQDLVDEARTRAGRRCPEWTDHNVSDPGMTLIDQFAWMTDILLYRVNQLPETLHWKLLELLGVQRLPPTAAHTLLRFRLAKPPQTEPIVIRAGTEVATIPDADHDAVVFQVTADAAVPPIELSALMLMRSKTLTEVAVSQGVARPVGGQRDAYSVLPEAGDALYFGFATSPARLLVQVHISATEARGTGIDPDLPPVVWEVPRADRTWTTKVEVLSDGTGGFNYPVGTTELAMPAECVQTMLGGKRLYWLRCRVVDLPLTADRYAAPPRIEAVSATAIGTLANACHRSEVGSEVLGTSDGTAGQRFKLLHAPALMLGDGEHLEVSDRQQRFYERWDRVDSFADSRRDDHHFRFDPAMGEVQFGPAIRVREGWRQHGAIPPKGARLVLSSYRHGGGPAGNVESGRLTVLRKPIHGVARVTNPARARGGIAVEPADAARLRAADELRTRYRAVTRKDFETIAMQSPHVARARCVKPEPGGPIVVQILPSVPHPRGPLAVADLLAPSDLRSELGAALEEASLLGTSVHVTPVALRVVTVAVEVAIGPSTDAKSVTAQVVARLRHYLNPLVGGDVNTLAGEHVGTGPGWRWGRPLTEGELRPLVRAVPGVEQINILRLYETDPETGLPIEPELAGPLALEPDELIASGPHVAHAVIPR